MKKVPATSNATAVIVVFVASAGCSNVAFMVLEEVGIDHLFDDA